MKNLKKFKQFNESLKEMIKGYNQSYPLSKLNMGQEIIYSGSIYYVIKTGDYAIEISPDKDAKRGKMLNQNMFNEKCMVHK